MQDAATPTRRMGFAEFKAELQSHLEELKMLNARMEAREGHRIRVKEETRVLREETDAILASIKSSE
jgi:hypothetical protein